MRHVLLAAALWIGTGPTLGQSVHVLLHELRAAHVHHHDGDADHGDQDAEHEDLLPSLPPTLVSAAPRVDTAARLEFALATPVLLSRERPLRTIPDHGPPRSPPNRFASAVPSNRAPPA
ncbi:MAG: hypothetical protein HY078_13485 [Elusimicrobia bacterium]|nr:hypothetical protein [Elusimicrobiota bacterium]